MKLVRWQWVVIFSVFLVLLLFLSSLVLCFFVAPCPLSFILSPPPEHMRPITIVAYPVSCNESGGTLVAIGNTSPSYVDALSAGTLKTSHGAGFAGPCPAQDLASGEMTQCVVLDFQKDSGSISIYGENVGATPIKC